MVLTVEFDIVSAEDGPSTRPMVGEALTAGDKSSNKAMSAAYKYMAFQAFGIPLTGEDNDADAHSPEFSSACRKARERLSSQEGRQGRAGNVIKNAPEKTAPA